MASEPIMTKMVRDKVTGKLYRVKPPRPPFRPKAIGNKYVVADTEEDKDIA